MCLPGSPLWLKVTRLCAVFPLAGACGLGLGCQRATSSSSVAQIDGGAVPDTAEGIEAVAAPLPAASATELAGPPELTAGQAFAALPPSLPSGVEVGARASLPVPGDRELLVYPAAAEQRLAFVYLHGVCGDVAAVESWAEVVIERGTLIVLRGDSACAARPGRYAWRAPIAQLARRIDLALARVKDWRGGLLDVAEVVLIGYSQGAARAEALAAHRPGRFSRVILASGPTEPDAASLAGAAGVVLLGGTEEDTRHLSAGERALQLAGVRARLFALPGAHHGQYGPEGARVMDEALSWLLGSPASEPGSAAAAMERRPTPPSAR